MLSPPTRLGLKGCVAGRFVGCLGSRRKVLEGVLDHAVTPGS